LIVNFCSFICSQLTYIAPKWRFSPHWCWL